MGASGTTTRGSQALRPRDLGGRSGRCPELAAASGTGDRWWPSVRGAARVSAGAAWFARGGRGSVLDPASARALGLTRGTLSRSCGHDLTLRLPVPPWHERRAARDNGTRAHRAPLRGAGCCARKDRVRPAATALDAKPGLREEADPSPSSWAQTPLMSCMRPVVVSGSSAR